MVNQPQPQLPVDQQQRLGFEIRCRWTVTHPLVTKHLHSSPVLLVLTKKAEGAQSSVLRQLTINKRPMAKTSKCVKLHATEKAQTREGKPYSIWHEEAGLLWGDQKEWSVLTHYLEKDPLSRRGNTLYTRETSVSGEEEEPRLRK